MIDDLQEILLDQETLAVRVAELGAQISADYAPYAQDGIILVCVLRGAAVFAADLARCIDLPLEMDFVVASSYGMSAVGSEEVCIAKGLSSDASGKHILVVEDILDTGRTLARLGVLFQDCGAKSVEYAALLVKKNRPDRKVTCKYAGFECPDEFIVGYGLDYAERYRNLPFVAALKPCIYQDDLEA